MGDGCLDGCWCTPWYVVLIIRSRRQHCADLFQHFSMAHSTSSIFRSAPASMSTSRLTPTFETGREAVLIAVVVARNRGYFSDDGAPGFVVVAYSQGVRRLRRGREATARNRGEYPANINYKNTQLTSSFVPQMLDRVFAIRTARSELEVDGELRTIAQRVRSGADIRQRDL